MKKNLIFVSTIEDIGLEVLFRDGRVYILPRGANFASAKVIGMRIGKLYKLEFQPMATLMSKDSSEEHLCELCHKRMAHLHHGALRVLKEIITGLPDFSTEHRELCRSCTLGTYTKVFLPSSEHRAGGIFDLINSDVCESMSTLSLSDHKYYVMFIDDFSKKTWIYFLKTKGEVFARFKEFKALVENQIVKKIKVLRLDNGGEFTSNEFRDFCSQEGIRR